MHKPAPVQHYPLIGRKGIFQLPMPGYTYRCPGTSDSCYFAGASERTRDGHGLPNLQVCEEPSFDRIRTAYHKHFSMSALQPVIPARLVPAEGESTAPHAPPPIGSDLRITHDGLSLAASGRSGLCATPSRCGLRSPLCSRLVWRWQATSGGSSSLRSLHGRCKARHSLACIRARDLQRSCPQ